MDVSDTGGLIAVPIPPVDVDTPTVSAQIIITDFAGRSLIKTYLQGTNQTIDLSTLHTGTYFIQLFDKSKMIIGTGKYSKSKQLPYSIFICNKNAGL